MKGMAFAEKSKSAVPAALHDAARGQGRLGSRASVLECGAEHRFGLERGRGFPHSAVRATSIGTAWVPAWTKSKLRMGTSGRGFSQVCL